MAASYIYGRKFPKRVLPTNNWVNGIADFDKTGGSYAFGRGIDYRSNPRELTLLPAATKESGSIYTGLPKWAERPTTVTDTFVYADNGSFYKRTSAGVHSLLRTVASSHGNGMKYYGEDDFVYYTSDKVIGRYGPIAGTPAFSDDYFGSQGGNPTNTNALQLLSASSQYADKASAASLLITGNIAIEAYVKPTTLPAVGSSMTILGKWDESAAKRSYKFDILGISGVFGDGSDGALTIAADTTDAPIDSAASGTSGATALTATNVSFAAGQTILIIQMQGTGAGTFQKTKIAGYTAGTITTQDPLNMSYSSSGSNKAQVLVLKQYSSVTINTGKTWTAKAWNGTVGGILSFLCQGTFTNNGTINGTGLGFRGATTTVSSNQIGYQGEGTGGTINNAESVSSNGNGGGGGGYSTNTPWGQGNGGGGGSNSQTNSMDGVTTGGGNNAGGGGGSRGDSSGAADLSSMTLGGGGGSGGAGDPAGHTPPSGAGGNGGALISIWAATWAASGGSIVSNGNQGQIASFHFGSGGSGAGGSIAIKMQTGTVGTLTANGGTRVYNNGSTPGDEDGGAGGDGRIAVAYLTSYTLGTDTPTPTVTQDNTLVTTASYQLRLGISNDGTAFEYLTKNVAIVTANYQHVAVSWVASTSIATFYLNGINQGTSVGTKTAISSNTGALTVGGNNSGAAIGNFLNALIDDIRLWNTTRSDSQISTNQNRELTGSEGGLVAYYKLNNAYSDLTANANDLTSHGSPVFVTDVPFSNATTRLDIDLSANLTAALTTTLTAAIDESAASKYLSFVPTKDPQKSMSVFVASKGTADWVFTIHDGINRVIATATVTLATLPSSGFYEVVWSSPWRPVIGQTYHLHITQSTADGTIETGTASNFSTAEYYTYYQFLVNDSDFHPIEQIINKIAIGNERYLATYDGSSYNPMALKFPAGYRVRALALWKEYLAIGCWKGTSISDFDEGIIFFWDGYSTTYNFYQEVPEGGINAMIGAKGQLHVIAGYQGDELIYSGADTIDKVKRVPKITPSNYVEVFPGAIALWRTMLRIGVSGNSDSSVIEKGVYTYGATNKTYANSLSYDYPISTGSRLSTVKIGMLYPVGGKLLVGWQDGAAYGVDVINPSASPQQSGTVENLVEDIGALWKETKVPYIRADFKALRTGESIQLKYKLDRAANWTSSSVANTVGATSLRLPIQFDRHREIQIAADLFTNTTTAPTLLEISHLEDFLLDEQQGIE